MEVQNCIARVCHVCQSNRSTGSKPRSCAVYVAVAGKGQHHALPYFRAAEYVAAEYVAAEHVADGVIMSRYHVAVAHAKP